MDENGERKRATIFDHVHTLDQVEVSRGDKLRFELKIDGKQLDGLIFYNQLLEYQGGNFYTGQHEDRLYKFKPINDHRGPYSSTDPNILEVATIYLLNGRDWEMTWDPISNIIADDPNSCAVYAAKFDLLNTQGWKQLKKPELQRDLSELLRNPSTDKLSHPGDIRMDGKLQGIVHMPYNLMFRMVITNGEMLMISRLNRSKNIKYSRIIASLSMRRNKVINACKEFQTIRVHFVFDVKHCGKFKARLVADGHLTKEPNKTVYSGVVSLRNLRLAMFLAELNGLQLWGADVGNSYLQALTKEKLNIVAGPEYEELQGHALVVHKALYGTRTGGARWHDKCFDILQQMDLKPSRADPDIWMKLSKDGTH